MPTIYIIGAGAIGKALAVFLKLAGKDVFLLRGSVDDQPNYTETIQIVRANQPVFEADISVSTLSHFTTLSGLVVLTNKSYGNDRLAQLLKKKVTDSPVVLLQNGLGVEQPFLDQNFPEIYRCVLFVTSQFLAINSLSYKPVSVSPIGIIRGNTDALDKLVQQLNTPDFACKAESDIQSVIWKKAISNCVFNSVCPLLEVDNGIFHRNENALSIAKQVIDECVIIAKEHGIALSAADIEQNLLAISKASDGQFISTLQDIRNNRKTEIDTLNIAVLAMAKQVNKEAVVPMTKLLGELIQLKSAITR